jgi:hypothetical protein
MAEQRADPDPGRLGDLVGRGGARSSAGCRPASAAATGEEVRRHFAMNGQAGLSLRADAVRVHDTADPEVVIAEFDYDGRAARGRTFRVSNIQVLRVRDGLIVETRDYHNHAALTAVLSSRGVESAGARSCRGRTDTGGGETHGQDRGGRERDARRRDAVARHRR